MGKARGRDSPLSDVREPRERRQKQDSEKFSTRIFSAQSKSARALFRFSQKEVLMTDTS